MYPIFSCQITFMHNREMEKQIDAMATVYAHNLTNFLGTHFQKKVIIIFMKHSFACSHLTKYITEF